MLCFLPAAIIFFAAACDSTSKLQADAGDDATAPSGRDDGHQPGDAYDEFWGPAPDYKTRLKIFDDIWEKLDGHYAGFGACGLDWDEVRRTYRPLIQNALSHGRFYARLSEIYALIHDVHTTITSDTVCSTPPKLRPPVYNWYDWSSSMGVCATPLEDDSLLVYSVTDDNPAGLAPGDIITGYDGRPWRQLLDEIDEMELPVCGRHGSAPLAEEYHRMGSVVNNAHLFEELDVIRYGESRVESIATEDLLDYEGHLLCTDQIPMDHVEFPFTDIDEGLEKGVMTTWTVLEDANIGYIYVYAWTGSGILLFSHDFSQAVKDLYDTDGLIIDHRFNLGGICELASGGLQVLFNEDVDTGLCAPRDTQSDDRTKLNLDSGKPGIIHADKDTFYDHPIAVLTGHHSVSAGDIIPYYLSFHPRVRRFGRITNGSFGSFSSHWSPDPYIGDLHTSCTPTVCVDADGRLLQGSEQYPEQSVWLDPGDVAEGVDTVVEAALEWIKSENAAE